ncbi:MAG: Tetratricopeptide 1 repeat-containing protein [Bacteroidetes bacterium]|nr:Tetratricopeptide 1 repeat-containing protein [Bacteroidota bacterium]
MDLFRNVMNNSYTDSIAKSMLVSALTLNLWRTFDENKTLMLLDTCNSEDVYAKQRALVGLCFVLAKYNRFLPYFPSIRNRLVLLSDNNITTEQLQNIIIQIIATTETEQISKKLQEEIFPELMKLRPLMDEGLNPENLMNLDEWGEINPQWEEFIEKSGASDKIQEFAEMQMEGADVYMSTFAMLKSFPFFSDFSNWFLPFDTNNSAIKPLFTTDDKSLIMAFLSSNVMCNSDRYSFCLSVLQMPDLQRNLMKQSFGEAAEQMEEISKDEALHSPNILAKNISKHYIQDLFRFFKLNSHHTDFSDMFTTSLILHKTYLFDLLSIDDTIKSNIADYYFSKKLYPQALELLSEIEKEGETSAALYQKMGYAYQQTSQLMQALEAYKKADLILPDDFWTNRKIALCYRLMGNTEKALETYIHTDFIKPDQLSVKMQIINCKIELKRTDEALRELMKLNEEYPEDQRIMREIMDCSFTAKNLQQAQYFSSILLETENLLANDYITAGNIQWCLHKNKEATAHYKMSVRLLNNDWKQFIILFQQGKNQLLANGIDEDDILLMLDGLNYEL